MVVLHLHLHLYLLVKKEKCVIWSSHWQKFIREYLLAKWKNTRIFQWCHDRIKLRWFFLNGVLLHSYTMSVTCYKLVFTAGLSGLTWTSKQLSFYSFTPWHFVIDNSFPVFIWILFCPNSEDSTTSFGNISREKNAKMTVWATLPDPICERKTSLSNFLQPPD